MGDGLLVEFASVLDAGAGACALAWQDGMGDREAAAEANRRLQYRIGINLAGVIVEGDDIHGDGVNMAARLEVLADAGGICFSSLVHENLGNRIGAAFADAGEHSLKNIARPVQVWQ